jgi:hypothetical protein
LEQSGKTGCSFYAFLTIIILTVPTMRNDKIISSKVSPAPPDKKKRDPCRLAPLLFKIPDLQESRDLAPFQAIIQLCFVIITTVSTWHDRSILMSDY